MNIPATIRINVPTTPANRVAVIKAIRVLTGMGLKEAKDASERLGVVQMFNTPPGITQFVFEDAWRTLQREGVEVGGAIEKILSDLRKLGAEALTQGEDELANEILQLVLAEKLRRNVTLDSE
jgi:hypothetical protein